MLAALPDAIPEVTIDALLEHIVLIDQRGTILSANKAWREFALANGGDLSRVCEGTNYLDVCDRAASSGCGDATQVGILVRDVLSGRRRSATFDYPCDAPHQQRWFSLKITALDHAGVPAVALVHDNITELKNCERQIQFQASLLASVEQAVIATDVGGTILYWNPFAEKLYGWSAAEALGRNIIELVPADNSTERAAQIMARLQAGCSWSGEFLVRHRNGTTFPMHVTDSPIRDEQGRLVGVIGISTDISEWKKTERALNLSAMVYEAIGEAIMITEPNGRIVAVNPAFIRLSGYTEQELIGQPAGMLLAGALGQAHNCEVLRRLEKAGHAQGKVWARHKNGDECAEWLRVDTIYDERGQVKFRVNMFSGITDQKLAEDTIWRQANFDFLTGLPNRSMFHDRLEHELRKSRRSGLPLALMFIDIDHFKEVNDTLGHDTGDKLLREVAARLSACIRQADTVARLGGDEFTVILGELDDLDSVERVAHAMLAALAEPFAIKAETLYLSGSIGITLFPHDATDVDTLLKNADQAMYAAKNRGRNQFGYFMQSMQRAAQRKMRTLNDLRAALALDQLRVLYQPIVELSSGRIRKAEALLRWEHPQRGPVSPAEFIPLAEESGLIISIGDWVFQQAFHQAMRWRGSIDPEFQISVNMSPAQFRRHSPGTKHACHPPHVRAHPVLGRYVGTEIVVEITEGMLMESTYNIREQLLSFRESGIQMSIDDFGTGYSSLSYLKKFHIDYLKIDQSFVLKMVAGSDDLALCEAIVVMGHKLGIKVIAEGVETQEQRDLLTAAGCDFGQGYLFSRPLTAPQFDLLLRTHNHCA
ncbi:EAL domain-containing protein [Massilia pseudoviolaceinigra]|uniref:EAL domain-containing protein n=1 Tax=Massilia pseudoviolaceinigra TaxID=3057165 RepID=UPI0027969545|nr:EAL domain-containing protein [Massilia sp. CCM 9206]MDQ1924320.1 EAL domain-containing protein [Massilia sp. CCM 9206]